MSLIRNAVSAAVLLGFVLLSGCIRHVYEPVDEREEPKRISASRTLVCVNDSLELTAQYEMPAGDSIRCHWSTDNGSIREIGTRAVFQAPAIPCTTTIRIHITHGGLSVDDSLQIIVYRQIVILKADDLQFTRSTLVSQQWIDFINLVNEKDIKACLGVIGQSLEQQDAESLRRIKTLIGNGRLEIWNHGYDHVVDQKDGEGNRFWEFRNTSLDHQREHILKTQFLARDRLGIVLRTFGAPGNAFDENTRAAIDDVGELRVWFFGSESSSKRVLGRYGEIEFPTHYPVYDQFLAHYDETRDYYVFQIHPNSWDQARLAEFGRIVDTLKQKQCTFLTALELDEGNPSPAGG